MDNARVRGYFRRACADDATKRAVAQDSTAFIAGNDRFVAMAEAAMRFDLTLTPEDTKADVGCAAHTNPLAERPSLLLLVEEAESGVYDVLVVYRVVDISRASFQVAEILSRLREAGVRVMAVDLATWRQAVVRTSDGKAVRCGKVAHDGVEMLRKVLEEQA